MDPADARAAKVGLPQRIGFWLGLILFACLLLCPTPQSMRRAARSAFATKITSDIETILEKHDQAGASQDSAAYRAAERDAVEAQARMMLRTAAVAALIACWWMTVAIPIPATSLLPLALLPAVGVIPMVQTAPSYARPEIFLFMGGFIIALGVERWGLHRRIALQIVRIVGTGRATIVLGFMIASAVLSMWISNTATAMMMLPIGLAVVSSLNELESEPGHGADFAAALMLGIAYAASIGGVATPIGTPPNIAFQGQYRTLFPDAPEISFGAWTTVFFPFVVVFVPLVWLVLTRVVGRVSGGGGEATRRLVRSELAGLGRMKRPEVTVLIVFAATALLWMTRSIPLGQEPHDNYGWAYLLERALASDGGASPRFAAESVNDATVAIAMAVLLFMLPAGRDDTGRRQALMNWDTAKRLPWGILLLFGGGFAIAAGFQASGLSHWCGTVFEDTGIRHPVALVAAICLMMTFLTEITSNTATAQVILPIVAQISVSMRLDPLLLMLPATISASCAFMLPVATPPNAIVFGSGRIEMGRMIRAGLILNFLGVILVTFFIYFVARPLLDIH